MISISMVTMDTPDARALAAWWAARLHGDIVQDMDGWFCIVSVQGMPVDLGFQKVADATPGKNRLHLDLDRDGSDDRDAVIAEWTAAGAVHLGTRTEEGISWDTFADPDGNEFCIGNPH